MLCGHLFIVEHTLELQSAQGVGDVVDGADGREYLMQHATRLNVSVTLGFLFVIAFDEGLTAVALTEGNLALVIAESDGQRLGWLQERILRLG